MLGLDCLPADVLGGGLMPTVAALADAGTGGTLRSTLPPITVPAWTSMLTGRDPGELGVYGFRNRRSYRYGDLVQASSVGLRFPRVWDRLAAQARPSVVVGVPQTSPPPAIQGVLVSGFEGPVDASGAYTHPPELAQEIQQVVGEYLFDVPQFRNAPLEHVRTTAYAMTERRFILMRHLLSTRGWDFAMLHEIGPDRMHHCFWHYHDPHHPRYEPDRPEGSAIRDYYQFLDGQVAGLLAAVGEDVAVLVASDHGATAMHGGVCVNDLLRQAGLLVLHEDPPAPTPWSPELVRWDKTSAWAEGGYYARVFFNIADREPAGVVARDSIPELTDRIVELLGTVDLGDGRVLHNSVCRPAELYRRVRGIPPDLLVFFDHEQWRSIGSVGYSQPWVSANDIGLDEANHSRNGMFALRVPGRGSSWCGSGGRDSGPRREADILDITPTLLDLLDLPPEATLTGRSLLPSLG